MKPIAFTLVAAIHVFAQIDLGKWLPKASMPIRKGECSGAVLGERLYIAGGLEETTGGTKSAVVYTPGTNTWDTIPSMPVGLHHLGFGAMNGSLFVLGGCDHARKASTPDTAPWLGSTHAFRYDTRDSKWRKIDPVLHSTGMGGVAAWGGRFYVIGGVDTNGTTLALVQEYNPASATWRLRSSMPTRREHIGVAVLDSLIYVVGGRPFGHLPNGQNGYSLKAFEAYSPASDKWYVLPEMPTARSGLALAVARGRLYAIGGEWPGPQATTEEFDPVKKVWRTVVPLPMACHGFPALAYRDSIYAFGCAQRTDVFIPPVNRVPLNLWAHEREFPTSAIYAFDALGKYRSGSGATFAVFPIHPEKD